MRPILILRKKILQIFYNLPFQASCTHLFIESAIQTGYAMYAGELLKAYFSRFEIFSKNVCPRHITWKEEGTRLPYFTMLESVRLQKIQSSTKLSICIMCLRKLVYGPLA